MGQLEEDTFVLLARQGDTLAAVLAALDQLGAAVAGLELSPSITLPSPTVVVGEGDGAAAAAAVRDAISPMLVALSTALEALGTKLDALAARQAKAAPIVTRGGGTNKVQLINSAGETIEGLPVTGTVNVAGVATEATLVDVKRGISDVRILMDYGTRSDGLPVYVGKALQDTAETVGTWSVQRLSYDASNRLVHAQVRTGAWADRATLGWY